LVVFFAGSEEEQEWIESPVHRHHLVETIQRPSLNESR